MLGQLSDFLPRRSDYRLAFFRQDLLAGLTVAVVALPLALGFGVTSGAGAAAGLFTAIVAGVVAAVFGGSSFQISGPTGAMTAVLVPIIARYGLTVLPVLGLLAGLILMVLGLARVGRYVRFVPWPVVTGFTNGIAAIIFLQQIPGALGAAKGEGENVLLVTWETVRNFLEAPNLAAPVLAGLSVALMAFWPRIKRLQGIPAGMATLLIVTLVSLLPAFGEVVRIGAIPRSLPAPVLPNVPLDALTDLFRAALAIAVLAALESLLSAVVADGMTIGEKHDPDRELFGQGLANVAAAILGGIPATAALARTAVNVRSGARTRLAAIVHGLVLLLVVVALAPLASFVPMAVLAGILMVVAARMVEREAAGLILRSTKSDAFVLLLTTLVTIFFDLILAVEVGMVAAAVLFIVRLGNMFTVNPEGLIAAEAPQHEGDEQAKSEQELLRRHIVVYRVDGPIFFGAANRFFDQLLKLDSEIRIVILRLRRVPVIDATGATALRSLLERLERQGILVFLSGLQPQPKKVLQRMGVYAEVTRNGHHDFVTTDEAIAHALEHLGQDDHMQPTRPPAAPTSA